MVATLVTLTIAGLTALFVGLKRSVRGYEDEFGFHEGVESPFCTLSSRTARAVAFGWSKNTQSSGSTAGAIIQATLGFY